MVYGIIGMINFAHGDIFMVGAFVSLMGALFLGVAGLGGFQLFLALTAVLVLAMVFTSVYGWTVERIAYRTVYAARSAWRR